MANNAITILGSSSGHPKPDRACSGYLLKAQESLTLLDCGGGISSSFLRRGYSSLDVARVFISHTHPDHVSDLPLFIQLTYLDGRTDPLDLYLPSEFVGPFTAFLPAIYLIGSKLPFDLNIMGYEDGFVFKDEIKITAVGNKHLQGNGTLISQLGLPNKMQCHSFDIEIAGKSVFYSSDIASLDEILPRLRGKDVAVIESTHIDIERLLGLAGDLNVGRFVISHLGTPDEVAMINEMATKAGVDNLVTALDGMEIEL
ncbi:MAG: MBL fold metallo-hydrolase [Candidatus Zixiibacteriota bacterium]